MIIFTYITNFLDGIVNLIFNHLLLLSPLALIVMYFVFKKPKHYSYDTGSSNYNDYSSYNDYSTSSSSYSSSDSYTKTPKEVGDDFENECAELFVDYGFSVNRRGLEMGVKDGGIDLIATRDNMLILVQCKNYRKDREIDDKLLRVFYADTTLFLQEHNVSDYKVYRFFVSKYSQLSYSGLMWLDGKDIQYYSFSELEELLRG